MHQSLVLANIGREGVHITSLLINSPSNRSIAIARHVGCPSNVGTSQLELMLDIVADDVGGFVGLRCFGRLGKEGLGVIDHVGIGGELAFTTIIQSCGVPIGRKVR